MRNVLIGLIGFLLLGAPLQAPKAEVTTQRLSGTLFLRDGRRECNEGLLDHFFQLLRERRDGDANMRLYHRLSGTLCELEVYLDQETVSLERDLPLKLVGFDDDGDRLMLAEMIPDPARGDPDFRFQIDQNFYEFLLISQVTSLYLEHDDGASDESGGIVLPRDPAPAVGADDLAIDDAGGLVPLDPDDLDLAGPPRDRYIGNAPNTTVQDFPDDLTPDQNLQTGGGACHLNPSAAPQGFTWAWMTLAGLVWLRRRKNR